MTFKKSRKGKGITAKNFNKMLKDENICEDIIRVPTGWLDDPEWLSEEVDYMDAYVDLSLLAQRHKDGYKGSSRVEAEFILVNVGDLEKRWKKEREDVIDIILFLKRHLFIESAFLWNDDYAVHINPPFFPIVFFMSEGEEQRGDA